MKLGRIMIKFPLIFKGVGKVPIAYKDILVILQNV